MNPVNILFGLKKKTSFCWIWPTLNSLSIYHRYLTVFMCACWKTKALTNYRHTRHTRYTRHTPTPHKLRELKRKPPTKRKMQFSFGWLFILQLPAVLSTGGFTDITCTIPNIYKHTQFFGVPLKEQTNRKKKCQHLIKAPCL